MSCLSWVSVAGAGAGAVYVMLMLMLVLVLVLVRVRRGRMDMLWAAPSSDCNVMMGGRGLCV